MKRFLLLVMMISSTCLNTYSQIIYTDLNPDTILTGSEHAFFMDLDGDSINDYALYHDHKFDAWPNDSGRVNGIAHFNNSEILCVVDGHMYPKSLYYNYLISAGASEWANYENNVPLFFWAMVNGVYENWGYFQNMTTDRYIGVKFNKDGDFHFGWIRIFIHPSGNYLVCRDYAYNNVPNEGIYTGEGIPTGCAKDIEIEDVDDHGDGRDILLSFTKAENEFTVAQYRLFVVKAEDTASFTIEKALTISPAYCSAALPNGNDHEISLKVNSKDVDGDLIVEDTEYVLYIVSYPKGNRADDHKIAASNSLILTSSSGLDEENSVSRYILFTNNSCIIKGNEMGVDFTLYDISGRLVKQYVDVKSQHTISGLNHGIYIITIIDNGIVKRTKLFIN